MIFDRQTEAYSLWLLGSIIAFQGDVEHGIPIVEQSLALYRSLGDKLGQANAIRSASLNHGDLQRSKSWLRESLKLYRELGHLAGIAFCLQELALRDIWESNFSETVEGLEEVRRIRHQLGDISDEGIAIGFLGVLAYWQGNYQQAYDRFEESVQILEKGNNILAVWMRTHKAYTLLRQGNLSQSKELFEICIQRFSKADTTIGLIFVIEGLASLNVTQGNVERAAMFFARADAMRETLGDPRPPIEQNSVERDLAIIHSKLNDAEFARLSAEGRTMTEEQAIALALEE